VSIDARSPMHSPTRIGPDMSASVLVSGSLAPPPDPRSDVRFPGPIRIRSRNANKIDWVPLENTQLTKCWSDCEAVAVC
jgi:hypothetical protein